MQSMSNIMLTTVPFVALLKGDATELHTPKNISFIHRVAV